MQSALNGGFGLLCAAEQGRLYPTSSATGEERVAVRFGALYPKHTGVVFRLAICGRHTKTLLTPAGIKWSERGLAKPPMSNVGTTHFVKEFADLSEKHCHFQRTMKCMNSTYIFSSLTTTCHALIDTTKKTF